MRRLLALLIVASMLTLALQNASSTMPQLDAAKGLVQPAQSSTLCPTPGPADISTQQIVPASTNATIPGNVIQPIQQGQAQFIKYLPADFQLNLELVFKIRNAAQFQQCLDSINDPSSSSYGQFLNSTTLEPFLPTPGQKTSVRTLLSRSGFNVTDGPSPLVLKLRGSAGSAMSAFGVQVALYHIAGLSIFAANADPEMPSNLAVSVNAVVGLDNYTQTKPVESPCSGPYCPQGIQVGYTLSTLYSSGYDGSGQTVAVIDAPGDPSPQTAFNAYNLQYSLPLTTLNLQTPDGTPTSYDPSWASEAMMDVEAVHAVAPGAGIILVYDTGNLMNGVDYIAQNGLANVISNSWVYVCGSGTCSDTQLSSAFVSSVDSRLATDVALGVTILFASGDQGAKPNGATLGTEFPASDPNVLAVGATNLILSGCGTTTCTGYSSESGAVISGGGYSGYFSEPSWQTSAIGTKSGRAVPDVSMLGYSPNFWVYSTLSDRCGDTTASNSWFGCAGTSLSTPLWAGFLAVVLQVRGGVQLGNAGPRLYQLASSASYSSIFHDITTGSNNGYSASTGWDPVTGWGTPQAYNLAIALAPVLTTKVASGSGSVSPNCPSGCNMAAAQQVSVSASPSAGWAFFSWTITGASCQSGLSVNPCTFTMPNNPVTVSVTFIRTTSITLAATPQTVTVGSTVQLSGSITPSPGSVQVVISVSPDNVSWSPLLYISTNSNGAFSTSWNPPSPGSYGLQASWGGNSAFQGSTSSTIGLTVTGTRPASPSLLLTAPATVLHGQTAQLSITIFNPSTGPSSTQVTIEVIGPGNYVSFDTVTVQTAQSSSTTLLYDWAVPTQTGGYLIIVETTPTNPSAYDSATVTVT